MNIKFTLWQKIVRAAIYVQSWLRLQVIGNAIQRTIKGEFLLPRKDLPVFKSPLEVEEYINSRFEWRPDQLKVGQKRIGLDYITNPRVFQAKLDSNVIGDGDCDDYHTWFAHCLQKIKEVYCGHERMVQRPFLVNTLSFVWKGGGHTVAVYTLFGQLYLVDYGIRIVPTKVNRTEWLVNNILDRYADGAPLRFFVFQDTKLRVQACNEDYL
jgi:hypothetical protein